MTEEEKDEKEDKEEVKSSESQEELKIRFLETELKEAHGKYLMLLADTENAKKRMLKDKQTSSKFAIEGVIEDFLTPMDNLENALGFAEKMSDEVRNWAMGFQMILSQFKDVLQQHGISPFESVGTYFDPHLHEAVETEETTLKPEGMIIQEFVRGYKCGDRAIRPARVKVAKSPPIIQEETN